jgi:hypothetical protein
MLQVLVVVAVLQKNKEIPRTAMQIVKLNLWVVSITFLLWHTDTNLDLEKVL